ncbi:MAG: flagellar hook-basal body complex protein FliE [Bdellovibrionales bacterium]
MVMNVAGALAAYRDSGTLAAKGVGAGSSGAEGGGFSDTLKGFMRDTVNALEKGEKAAVDGATGKADIASVVTAISNAELMLQEVVTIRDKVIAAYQEITRTQI